ncbi:MAG: hypothetical protein H0X64_03165 [Gemmatimonadaceae bacterium]|nr:hypothetical protein [Gemmatimonadaceae bacterium]
MTSTNRTQLGTRIALFVIALAATASTAGAQRTTKDTEAIVAGIRALYAETERDLPGYRKVQRELEGWSVDGGTLTGAFDGTQLRKLAAEHIGETWHGTEEHYFRNDSLVFAYVVHHVTGEPMSEQPRATIEHRLYFDAGRLIRRTRIVRPARLQGEHRERDPEVDDVIEGAAVMAACVRAADAAKPCVAPGYDG